MKQYSYFRKSWQVPLGTISQKKKRSGMFKSPVVLGVFSQSDVNSISLERLYTNTGKNTGNLLFSESLLANLGGASKGHLGLSAAELDVYDCIVLAAANWLDSVSDFGPLYEKLKATNKPIVIVGLGAQASLESEMPVLKPGTVNLLRLIAERSNAISVRGKFSGEVLYQHGIRNLVVTGCPSLLLCGVEAPLIRSFAIRESNRIVIGATRHGFESADLLQLHLYRQAMKSNLNQILQSELADMYFATARVNNQDITTRAMNTLRLLYAEGDKRVASYLSQKAHVFFSLSEWIDYMKTMSFYVGTRLHGVVASLLAGTPATLIAHDSRTLESAIQLNLPYVLGSDIDLRKDIDFSTMYEESKIDVFRNGYSSYRSTFKDFFAQNSLAMY